jgi:hypothetical protein
MELIFYVRNMLLLICYDHSWASASTFWHPVSQSGTGGWSNPVPNWFPYSGTGLGLASAFFVHSGTGLTGCRTVWHSGILK